MISASRLPTKGGKWFGGIFMNALHTILTIIQVILAVGLVVIVTIQSGKSAGLSGAIAGGSGDTYLGKTKTKGGQAGAALAPQAGQTQAQSEQSSASQSTKKSGGVKR